MEHRWFVFNLDDAFVVIQEGEAVERKLDRDEAIFGPVAERALAEAVAAALNFARDDEDNDDAARRANALSAALDALDDDEDRYLISAISALRSRHAWRSYNEFIVVRSGEKHIVRSPFPREEQVFGPSDINTASFVAAALNFARDSQRADDATRARRRAAVRAAAELLDARKDGHVFQALAELVIAGERTEEQ